MRYRWLAVVGIAALTACGSPTGTPTVNVAPTQTRVAELAQIASLQATTSAPTAITAATSTPAPPTATAVPPTATAVPPTATQRPPTSTPNPPTATAIPPTATVPPAPTQKPPTPTPTQKPPTPAPTKNPARAGVGEVATNGIVVVFVHSLVDPLKAGQYFAPDKGNRWVALDVSIQNVSNKEASYNELYTSLKTTDNHEFNGAIFTDQEPTLKSGDLDPQETARGWVTFEIPQGAQVSTFNYSPFTGSRIIIDLR